MLKYFFVIVCVLTQANEKMPICHTGGIKANKQTSTSTHHVFVLKFQGTKGFILSCKWHSNKNQMSLYILHCPLSNKYVARIARTQIVAIILLVTSGIAIIFSLGTQCMHVHVHRVVYTSPKILGVMHAKPVVDISR